jgi:hypothetical protein
MLHCHTSQFYEWLPYNQGVLDKVPTDEAGRRRWLTEHVQARLRPRADKYRGLLCELYGEERGRRVEFAEAFEPCEYGARMTDAVRRRLFPFIG